MANLRPPLDAYTGAFWQAATVTLPGQPAVSTVAMELAPFVERFPGDSGAWSMTKSRRRLALRLDQLPAGRAGLSWPPPGTVISVGGELLHVEGVDTQDDEIVHVLVR